MNSPYIKICGITKEEETAYLNEAQVEFMGNVLFFEKSHRCIGIDRAKQIHREILPQMKKVAVVVSPTKEQLLQIEDAGFDYVQIHGQLPPISELEGLGIGVLRAFNGTSMTEQEEALFSQDLFDGYLLDAAMPGSGVAYDPNLFDEMRNRIFQKDPRAEEKLLFLAGGLTPQNAASVIEQVHPAGVDISSGVELADKSGKDPEAIRAFVQAVRGMQQKVSAS